MTISIVTGGAGFIGSHIVEKLKRLDHMVVVIDNEYSDNDNFHWRKDTLNVNIVHFQLMIGHIGLQLLSRKKKQ